MPLYTTHSWNLTSFIGAFLNLSIACLLLCISLFIHLVLRFLEFLSFPLPRFHNGCFDDANMKNFLQKDLVHCASRRISAVNRSIKNKIPFGSITSDDDSNHFVELKLVRKNRGDISNARVKDETDEDVSKDEHDVNNNNKGEFNLMTVQGMKGKRIVTRRSRNGLKSHRRGRSDCGSLKSFSSSEALDENVKNRLMQPYDVFIRAKDERCSIDNRKDYVKAGGMINMSHWPELEKTLSIDEHVNNSNPSSEELSLVKRTEESSVKELKESLKEERAARVAVCVELDKERSAAASAADEAMAMIHRLQDEKATIEMEWMQFQRMVEEKSTFDAEEMVILKDILIRREREKHFLEKEVEAYRELLVEAEEIECSLTKEENLPESTEKTVQLEDKKEEEYQEKRALLVQELDGTVLDVPCREEENRERNRHLYKSDSEVTYSRVRDVYMVKDETENIRKKKKLEESSVSKPEGNGVIVTGIARKLPPLCRPRKTSLSSSGSRRKSMSAVDYERLKIENEVEQLRERLKVVQEERAELTRRSSLPPLSSKVRNKRGWRSASMDVHYS